MNEHQWMRVLRLAALWGFTSIKSKAVAHIQSILEKDPVQAVFLANDPKNCLEHWMLPAVTALARRGSPLSTDEARVLGLDLALKVMHVRERAFEGVGRLGDIWNANIGKLVPPRRATWDFQQDIIEIFGIQARA